MSEDNKALVRRFYDEIFTKKNANAIDEICSPDFVDRNPMPGQSPGRQGMKDSFAGFLRAFPDMAVTIVEFPGFSGHPFAAACEPLRIPLD